MGGPDFFQGGEMSGSLNVVYYQPLKSGSPSPEGARATLPRPHPRPGESAIHEDDTYSRCGAHAEAHAEGELLRLQETERFPL